jgi:hypothetical protein
MYGVISFITVNGDKLAKWLDFDATGKKYLTAARQEEVRKDELD